jgi:hypothetical protein
MTSGPAEYDLDISLIKINSTGGIEWINSHDLYDQTIVCCIQQTNDGGFAACGYYEYDYPPKYGSNSWFIKTDEDGNLEWNKEFGGESYDFIRSFQQTSDGGFILGGNSYSYGSNSHDIWLIKLDSNGNEKWSKTHGDSDAADSGYSIKITNDGGYIIVGSSWDPGSMDKSGHPDRTYLIKTNSKGDIEWEKHYEDGKEIPEELPFFYIILIIIIVALIIIIVVWHKKKRKK